MSYTLQQSFEEHSKIYADRVLDRKKYANLSLEDDIIACFLHENVLTRQKRMSLIDAGCGTGHRLQRLLSECKVPHSSFAEIIGIDYAKGMLLQARDLTINGTPLYTKLLNHDLLANSDNGRGDVVLCLWGIVNCVLDKAALLLSNLRRTVLPEGLLVYDIMTTRALDFLKEREVAVLVSHRELQPFDDPQCLWYERDDGTVGYSRLFLPEEINQLFGSCEFRIARIVGYNHLQLKPTELPGLSSSDVARYSTLLVFEENTTTTKAS